MSTASDNSQEKRELPQDQEFEAAVAGVRGDLASGKISLFEALQEQAEASSQRCIEDIEGGVSASDAIFMHMLGGALAVAQILGHDAVAALHAGAAKLKAEQSVSQ